VNWAEHARRLEEVDRACNLTGSAVPHIATLREWRDRINDGTLKLYLTARLLRLRRDAGSALATGGYVPLRAEGAMGERIVAFQRGNSEGMTRIVVVSRLMAAFGSGAAIGARWGDTRLMTGANVGEWQCELSGARLTSHAGMLNVADVLAELPVALLAPTNTAQLLEKLR
jgi:(1->4)-alpha-D-glucan 1-alpha-D-glucosylmutase